MKNNIINQPTIFTGCDSTYWKKYGKSFVNSFKKYNPDKIIHIHLCNPTQDVLNEISMLPCNYSVQIISDQTILKTKDIIKDYIDNKITDSDFIRSNLKFSLKFFNGESLDDSAFDQSKFIHFACSRFIALSEYWTGDHPVAAYDIDSICRGNISFVEMLNNTDAGCLSVKGNRFVVSLVAFQHSSGLLYKWGKELKQSLETNKIWGFLDQDTFVTLSKEFTVNPIDRKFCDHTSKNKNSFVITGKGQTKHSNEFQEEIKKWQ
jgi:hypothetical protein